jgi:hypothetical protein
MLNPAEKAYLEALQSLKRNEYRRAAHYFDQAAPFFAENQEFILLRETTSLLVAVKEELRELEADKNDERIEIEEYF